MLFFENAKTEIGGTEYSIEYAITKEAGEEESDGQAEYGIRCELFEREASVHAEEVKGITADTEMMKKLFRKIVKNQVFPVHLRDVIEDLLIEEHEVRESFIINSIEKERELSTHDKASAEGQCFFCSQCELFYRNKTIA